MITASNAQPRDRLQAVSEAFAEWRRSRSKREPIPEFFWQAATALSPDYSTYQIAKALRLNYARVKLRIEGTAPNVKGPGFIELKPETLFAAGRCSIHLQSPDGSRMEIRAETPALSQFAALITAFLDHRR